MTILMRVAALVGAALLVLIFNVAATVLYMVVYGHLIDPGHEASYYEKHVQAAGPYCSIVFGIPLMAATGWWVAGWWRREWGLRGPIGVWLAYTSIDLAILIGAGLTVMIALLFVASFSTKLAAIWWGAVRRLGSKPRSPGLVSESSAG